MTVFEALLLGTVQGLTEFLPVSSSGHLVIGQALLGVQQPGIAFEILVHVATALSIYLVYFRDVHRLATAVVRIPGWMLGRRTLDPDLRLATLLLIGSIPAGLAGIMLRSQVEALFASVTATGFALLFTATLLLLSSRFGRRGFTVRSLHGFQAILIGVFQAIALIPGVSRSGSTISGGLWLGMERTEAARFSFLLALPAILGATVVDMVGGGFLEGLGAGPAVAGFVAAAVSGYLAIRLLVQVMVRGHLHRFAYYCFAAGVFAIVFGQLT